MTLATIFDQLTNIMVSEAVASIIADHISELDAKAYGNNVGSGGAVWFQGSTIKRGGFELIPDAMNVDGSCIYAVVGKNGAGKSTLFDALQEIRDADIDTDCGNAGFGFGESSNPDRKQRGIIRIARLNQEEMLSHIGDMLVTDVLSQFVKHFMDEVQIDDNDWMSNDDSVLDSLDFRCAAQTRIEVLATDVVGLLEMEGFLNRQVHELSGGEKTKLCLVMVMMADPDIALFDEPTNHLDLETISKLIGVINRWKDAGKTSFCSSHVGWFLKATSERTMAIEKNGGNMSHLRYFSSPFRKMERHLEIYNTGVSKIEWAIDQRPRNRMIIEGQDHLAIDQSPINDLVTPTISGGELHMLLGSNGCGKTKLIEELYGNQDLQGEKVNIAYLPQFWSEEFYEDDFTIDDFFNSVVYSVYKNIDDDTYRQLRNTFRNQKLKGTSFGASLDRPLNTLSGGEQRLLWFLAMSSLPCVDALILDEPTNHMDCRMRQLIIEAIDDFTSRVGGAIVMATHDLDVIESLGKHARVSILSKENGNTRMDRYTGESIIESTKESMSMAQRCGGRVNF